MLISVVPKCIIDMQHFNPVALSIIMLLKILFIPITYRLQVLLELFKALESLVTPLLNLRVLSSIKPSVNQ